MARPRKKLKQADISKNSSIKISGVINKIKANERRYTISLVIIFMGIFIVVGFFTLRLNVKQYDEYLEKGVLSLYSKVVVLQEDDMLSDEDGIKTESYYISVYNGLESTVRYRILLVQDETLTSSCGCSGDIKPTDIKFSFGGDVVTFDSFEEMVIDSGKLEKFENQNSKVKVWLSEDATTHFHGRFIVEKIKTE